MKTIRILCLILSAFFMTMPVFATSQITSADSFKQVQQQILNAKDPHHLLVVLDDDDTLTMMPCPHQKSITQCQYLGGPAWFAWQMSLSHNDTQRVWGNFSQLLTINGLILNMSKMPLVDPAIPSALIAAHQVGAHILVATARGYSMLGATETQFQQDGILNTIEQNALKTPSDHISFPGYYFPPIFSDKKVRRIAYIDGVLYLSGQNKGVMLKLFLQKMHQTKNITQIIFVDDTFQNVKDVANAYAANPNVNVVSIHFTRLAAHKAALTQGKNASLFQMMATTQWNNLKMAMKNNLLEPNL